MTVRPALILPHGLPLRRMLIALCASLCVHFLIVGGWGGAGAARTIEIVLAPLQARLQPMTGISPPPAEVDTPAEITRPQPAASPYLAAAPGQSPSRASASGQDLRFYLARELDRYPSPLSALGLDGEKDGGRGTATARLWVSIDQAGRVIDATVIDANPPGEVEHLARERVLATRFMPAWRDGRPVKSRVLLVLGQGG